MVHVMRHQETLNRAASSIEQVLARNSELMPVEMWSRVDELLLSVRFSVHFLFFYIQSSNLLYRFRN